MAEDGFCPNCFHPLCERCSVCSMCGHGTEIDLGVSSTTATIELTAEPVSDMAARLEMLIDVLEHAEGLPVANLLEILAPGNMVALRVAAQLRIAIPIAKGERPMLKSAEDKGPG